MENQMEKNMEHEMETGSIKGLVGMTLLGSHSLKLPPSQFVAVWISFGSRPLR